MSGRCRAYHLGVPKYSIVVPFHNEEENVTTLYDRVKLVMEQVGEFVRDGVCGRWIARPNVPAAGGDCGGGQPGAGDQAAAELWADVGAGGGVRPRAGGVC